MATNQTKHVLDLVTQITSATSQVQEQDNIQESARKIVLEAAKQLVTTLEDPKEVIYQHAYSGPERLCMRLGITLRIFHLLAGRQSSPASAQEISGVCGAEASFIVRIMRVLAAMNFVNEKGEELYEANPVTVAMTVPSVEAGVLHTYDHAFRLFSVMPSYFESRGYKCPTDPDDAPFQYALGTKLRFFDYLDQEPKRAERFNTFMTANKIHRPRFEDWYPVRERILDGYTGSDNSSGVLMIDIGGGFGHDLERFKQKFPQAAQHGRLILQDVPQTIANANVSGGIEAMGYDFFTPQPVKGARVYYFHRIHHNWPDDIVRKILRNTVSAMKPGYSKLILNEYILPAENCPLLSAYADIHMMAAFSASERTEKQWRELLGSEGLSEVSFWYPPEAFDGVVEASLPDPDAKLSHEP